MLVNNATITGEPDDLPRSAGEKYPNVFESPNVALLGAQCVQGVGKGIVFRTGNDTVMGRICA